MNTRILADAIADFLADSTLLGEDATVHEVDRNMRGGHFFDVHADGDVFTVAITRRGD